MIFRVLMFSSNPILFYFFFLQTMVSQSTDHETVRLNQSINVYCPLFTELIYISIIIKYEKSILHVVVERKNMCVVTRVQGIE